MHTPESSQNIPFLERQGVKDFIERRAIRPEDFSRVEKLSRFSKSFVIEHLHNFFGFEKGRSAAELRRLIAWVDRSRDKKENDAQYKELLEEILYFVEQYDWTVAYNLETVLERGGVQW